MRDTILGGPQALILCGDGWLQVLGVEQEQERCFPLALAQRIANPFGVPDEDGEMLSEVRQRDEEQIHFRHQQGVSRSGGGSARTPILAGRVRRFAAMESEGVGEEEEEDGEDSFEVDIHGAASERLQGMSESEDGQELDSDLDVEEEEEQEILTSPEYIIRRASNVSGMVITHPDMTYSILYKQTQLEHTFPLVRSLVHACTPSLVRTQTHV